MSTHLSAFDTLALIHHELGAPDLAVVEPREGPRGLRSAVASAREHVGATLIAVPTSGSQTAQVRTWFSGATSNGLHSLPFDGGVLLLLLVPGRRRPLSLRKPDEPQPWNTPDASPVSAATEPDLDDAVVRHILRACDGDPRRRVHAPGTATERYLAGYGLLAHDGACWRPTVAAMVLCGLRPDLFLPGCVVHVDVDAEVTDLSGSLRQLLRNTLRAMPADIDTHVVSEAVVNALLHRDWTSEEPTHVELDSQRLTITHPGSIGPGLQGTTNPLLLHLTRYLGLASGQGRGLPDIRARLVTQHLPPPSLFERDGSVVFVADLRRKPSHPRLRETPRNPPHAVETSTLTVPPPRVVSPVRPALEPTPSVEEPAGPPAARSLEPSVVPALLPRDPEDRADVVLAHLRTHRHASTRELAATLGCSRPVVGKLITRLVAEGRIRPLVASSRSPHQRYALVEDHPQL